MTTLTPFLLQIADSAFPTGAFAYSSGVEALARSGRFPDVEKLEAYFETTLRQAESFELAFVAAAHESTSETALLELCRTCDAYSWNQGMRKASLRQGRAFLDLLSELFPRPQLESLRRISEREKWPLHFGPTVGRSLALLQVSRVQACWIFLHGLIRDQVAAVVRLGLLGSRAAQVLQARVMARATDRLGDGSHLPAPENAWRTAPLIEVGQGAHGFLYSRLFQN